MKNTNPLVMKSFYPNATEPYIVTSNFSESTEPFKSFTMAARNYLAEWSASKKVEVELRIDGVRHVLSLDSKAQETRVALAGLLDSSLGSDVQEVLRDAIDRLAELERA